MNEDRLAMYEEYQGTKISWLWWPWTKYTRYFEADHVIRILKEHGEDISKLSVLDFGCAVGDYGMQFARQGAEVYFHDVKTYIDFIKFRISKEPNLNVHYSEVKEDGAVNLKQYFDEFPPLDVVILGEVLEHLDDPVAVLDFFKGVKYLFTSSYPYRGDDPNEPYWKHHGEDMSEIISLQKPCREILETNFTPVQFDGQMRVWIKK